MANFREHVPYREPTPGPFSDPEPTPGPSPSLRSGQALIREGSSRREIESIRTVGDVPFLPYRHDLTARSRELRKKQTDAERVLWNVLRKRGFKGLRFVRQKPIICYIVDFFCSELMLAVEVDGEIHDNRKRYDSERTIELEQYGINVIRYTNDQILYRLSHVLIDLSEKVDALKQRVGDNATHSL